MGTKTFKVGDKVAVDYSGNLTIYGVVVEIGPDEAWFAVATDRNKELMYFTAKDLLPVGELTEALFL